MHASPTFWEFMFEKESECKVATVKLYAAECYGGTTCVYIAQKAFKMGLQYSLGDVDCTTGTLANKQKKTVQ